MQYFYVLYLDLPKGTPLGFPDGSERVKNLSVIQETQVWSMGQEDPVYEEMATHSSILAWKIVWTEKIEH